MLSILTRRLCSHSLRTLIFKMIYDKWCLEILLCHRNYVKRFMFYNRLFDIQAHEASPLKCHQTNGILDPVLLLMYI